MKKRDKERERERETERDSETDRETDRCRVRKTPTHKQVHTFMNANKRAQE